MEAVALAGVVPAGVVWFRPGWRGLGETWAWSWVESGWSPAETGRALARAGVGRAVTAGRAIGASGGAVG